MVRMTVGHLNRWIVSRVIDTLLDIRYCLLHWLRHRHWMSTWYQWRIDYLKTPRCAYIVVFMYLCRVVSIDTYRARGNIDTTCPSNFGMSVGQIPPYLTKFYIAFVLNAPFQWTEPPPPFFFRYWGGFPPLNLKPGYNPACAVLEAIMY